MANRGNRRRAVPDGQGSRDTRYREQRHNRQPASIRASAFAASNSSPIPPFTGGQATSGTRRRGPRACLRRGARALGALGACDRSQSASACASCASNQRIAEALMRCGYTIRKSKNKTGYSLKLAGTVSPDMSLESCSRSSQRFVGSGTIVAFTPESRFLQRQNCQASAHWNSRNTICEILGQLSRICSFQSRRTFR